MKTPQSVLNNKKERRQMASYIFDDGDRPVHVKEVTGPSGKKAFSCPVPGCTFTKSSRQHVYRHLLDSHSWKHLAAGKCMCCNCNGRLYLDESHVRVQHQGRIQAVYVASTQATVPIGGRRQLPEFADDRVAAAAAAVTVPLPSLHLPVVSTTATLDHVTGISLANVSGDFTILPIFEKEGSLRVECPVCHLDFGAQYYTIGNHLLYKHESLWRHLGTVQCTLETCPCERRWFVSQATLETHQGRFKKSGDKDEIPPESKRVRHTYVCTAGADQKCGGHCGREFEHLHAYQRHMGLLTVKCPHEGCESMFTNTGDASKHAQSCLRRPDVEKKWPCDLCDHVAPSASALQRHKTGPVHVARPREHACEVCGEAFLYPSTLKKHFAVHAEGRPHGCAVCDQRFKSLEALTRHAQTHVDTREFVCEESGCGNDFKTRRSLLAHQRIVHGEHKFQCLVCDEVFREKRVLTQHELTHDSFRQYACSFCDMRFRQKSVLNNHVVYVHTHNRTFVCDECDMPFTSPGRLESHKRIHTGDFAGRSRQERMIFRVLAGTSLQFSAEVAPSGKRFRFDFLVIDPVTSEQAFIEYDGPFHFRPISTGLEYRLVFLGQVSRDLDKARYARSSGCRLLRLSGSITESGVRAEVQTLFSKASASKDMSEYVAPTAFSSSLVSSSWAVTSESILAAVASLADDDALCMLGDKCPEISDLSPEEYAQYPDAVVVIFSRRFAEHTIDQLAREFSPRDAAAFVKLMRQVPEFHPDGPGPFKIRGPGRETTPGPGAVETPSTDAPGFDRPPYTNCWFDKCTVKFINTAAGAAGLLTHVNHAHKANLTVGCAWCESSGSDFAQLKPMLGSHSRDCGGATASHSTRIKRCRCGVCGFACSDRPMLYRHFNTNHGAKFCPYTTLMCATCGQTGGTYAEIDGHVSGVACRRK